jgi:acyl-coenzyme A synthetase/AMP-(fatty) acid ligase
MYGLTECKRVSILMPDQLDSHRGSVGLPLPGTRITVIDDTGVERASGVGQLTVRGPHVMVGYWNDPTETARRYTRDSETGERILLTGDRCRIDADGYLYFLGRDEMLIKRRSHRISVAEVESFLCSLDGVSEAGVVGIPDEFEGEQMWAYVSVPPEVQLPAEHMKERCLATLGAECCPQWFVITRSPLPKTTNGKIDRLFLRQLAEAKGELSVEDL